MGSLMTPDQQTEVWSMLDREHLARVARSRPEPIFAAISGAHLYGFVAGQRYRPASRA